MFIELNCGYHRRILARGLIGSVQTDVAALLGLSRVTYLDYLDN